MPEDRFSLSPLPQDKGLSTEEDHFLQQLGGGGSKKYVRFLIAALGSIPWVGSVISAAVSLNAEKDQEKTNQLQKLWLQEHQQRIKDLGRTFQEITSRLDTFGDQIQQRLESEEYLALVRRTFSSWDQADTYEKKEMLKRLITNAGAITLCPDDLIRLFINWIDRYHEAHFLVIKTIYLNPGITRGGIWDAIHGIRPREDSAEADLFKYLIRELNISDIIRQQRETNSDGEYVRKTSGGPRGTPSKTLESAFEETKPYQLTELGKEFVHYVMKDVAPQLEAPSSS